MQQIQHFLTNKMGFLSLQLLYNLQGEFAVLYSTTAKHQLNPSLEHIHLRT